MIVIIDGQHYANLEAAITAIPHGGEWWSSSSEATFLAHAKKLVRMGLTEAHAAEECSDLYLAVAECFGN